MEKRFNTSGRDVARSETALYIGSVERKIS